MNKFQLLPDMPARRADLPPNVNVVMPTAEDVHEFNEFALTRHVRRCQVQGLRTFLGEEDDDDGDDVGGGGGLDGDGDCVMMDDSAYASTLSSSSSYSHAFTATSAVYASSFQHEHDWLRLTHCYDPWLDAKIKIRIYSPGMLDGLWEGRQIVSF